MLEFLVYKCRLVITTVTGDESFLRFSKMFVSKKV